MDMRTGWGYYSTQGEALLLILASPSPWKLQKGERPGKGTRDTGRVKERGYCGS